MSSALSLMVFGQVYFLGPVINIPSVTPNTTTLTSTIDERISQPEALRMARRSDYIYTPGIGGHKVHSYGDTWDAARKICETENGHLAIINSVTESKLIGKLFQASLPHNNSDDSNYAHIGFHDLFKEGEFVTVLGQPLRATGFYEWQGDGPDNNLGVQNCGAVSLNGKLDDNSCLASLGFVCELPYVAED